MHTTLATLKEVKACIPGYTRMVSFFSTRHVMKEVKIPLFMIPLVGQSDDCTWALQNGSTIDPDDYARFRARNLPWVVRAVFDSAWASNVNRTGVVGQPPQPVADAFREFFAARTDEEVVAWFTKWSLRNYNHWLWTEVLKESSLHVPASFVYYAVDRMEGEISEDMKFALLRRDYAETDAVIFNTAMAAKKRRYSRDDDDEDEDESSDDGDSEDDDELDEAPRRSSLSARKVPARKIAVEKTAEETAEDLRKERILELENMGGRGAQEKWKELGWSTRVCPFYTSNEGLGVNMARLLCDGADPYQKAVEFIAEHDLAQKTNTKGFMLSKANDKEPPGYHLTLNLSDPRSIFAMFHVMKAQELRVADMFGVNAKADEVSNLLRQADGFHGRTSGALESYEAHARENGTVILLTNARTEERSEQF